MTGRKSDRDHGYRQYVGIESGLIRANPSHVSVDKDDMDTTRTIVELIVLNLIKRMVAESRTFEYLYVAIFGGGSGYEGLKITKPDEFDIDILMRIPKIATPVLLENNIPGYVNLRLDNFEKLRRKNPEVHSVMKSFVDEKNYLLTKEMKSSFMQSIFDRVIAKVPGNIIRILNFNFKISRIQNCGPAFTLTIEGPNEFKVSVDLVPCILLDASHWPGKGFKRNPYSSPSDFFLVPKSPKTDRPHIDRYWRLSFQKQEKVIIFDKQWLKPTIRILKRIRDHFGHKISSYAIKTMFLEELKSENPDFEDIIPTIWLATWSYSVVYMLETYAKCVGQGVIPYFWNTKMNLLEDLDRNQQIQYQRDIENMLQDIKVNTRPETILKYLG